MCLDQLEAIPPFVSGPLVAHLSASYFGRNQWKQVHLLLLVLGADHKNNIWLD